MYKSVLTLARPIVTIAAQWETLETEGEPVPRHEAAFVEFSDEFYLLGGRDIRPVSIYNPAKNSWRNVSKPPVEFHHFQPVTYKGKILIICAMSGPFPKEKPLDRILIYDPANEAWSGRHEIPEERRCGSAGVVLVDGQIYATGEWIELNDAENKRDHFQCAYLEGKIYAGADAPHRRVPGSCLI